MRSLYSLIQLLHEEVDFFLVTGNTDLGETDAYQGIQANTWVQNETYRCFYFDRNNINTASLLKTISDVNPDLIYLNSFWSYNFSIRLVRLKKANRIQAPILLAPRGMLSSGAMGLKSRKKSAFIKLGKMLGWYKHIHFQATQEIEQQEILRQFPSSRVSIAPNVNAGVCQKNESVKQADVLKLFYLSRIARVKNLHLALACLVEIPPLYSITYTIYGNLEDEVYWESCQQLISELPAHIKVVYAGELPFTSVQKTLIEQHVLFLPTLNENFGHSIVESLLCGCPVIISDQTPWNDLKTYNAGHALSLQDKKAFQSAIEVYAGMSQEEFLASSLAANNYISSKIDLSGIKKQYRQMFDERTKN